MGQTLSHGVYLPAEGERNCYSGLASNWNLLDTAIGDTAGKASATHTHGNISNDGKVGTTANLPLITGTGGAITAGAFGNQANTFCEGNDSRLSDARTPVAHTHTKSDVTDLFNSANTWSKVQTYLDGTAIIIKNNGVEIGNEPSAYKEQRVVFADKNGTGIAAIKSENQVSSSNVFVNGLEFVVVDKFKEGVRDPTGTTVTNAFRMGLWNDGTKFIYNEGRWRTSLIPFTSNAVDVGSSSYQWNNLYAKNYFYNGTAWGLDKANVWGNTQTVTGNDKGWNIINPDIEKGVIPSANKSSFVWWADKNNNFLGRICSRVHTDGTTMLWLSSLNYYKNGALDPTGSSATTSLILGVDANAYKFVQTNADFRPDVNNTSNLGTSTNKWATLNGVNPGALSFPNMDYSDTNKWKDIRGDITNQTGGDNWYTPTEDGWIFIIASGNPTVLNIFVKAGTASTGRACLGCGSEIETASGARWLYCPVPKGSVARIRYAKGTGVLEAACFVTCQGNV